MYGNCIGLIWPRPPWQFNFNHGMLLGTSWVDSSDNGLSERLSELLEYSEGGPNDPRTTFNDLRKWLTAVKEELSPWGWQAYDAEFRERMQAEKKLYAMNGLPNSGAEPKDGVIQGTPLWQERLDQMLLVEHLKRKVMVAHTAFTEATDLLLKSHAWLVKDSLLADKFAECISRVPPSQHDRIDILQADSPHVWDYSAKFCGVAMVVVRIENAVSGNLLGQCDADTLPELKAWIFACLKIPVWEQRILFDDKTLSDSDCLTALGVEFHEVRLQLLRLDSSWASALEAVKNDGNDLEQLEHLQGDRDIVMAAVKSSGAALRLVSRQFAAESLRRDPQIALAAVSQDGNALRYTHLKADRQVVLAAVSNCGLSIQHAAPHLHRDIEIGATAMMEDQRALEFIPQDIP
eukprot:s278_g10.t1